METIVKTITHTEEDKKIYEQAGKILRDEDWLHSLQRLYMDLEQMRLMRRLQLRYMQQREDHLTILL